MTCQGNAHLAVVDLGSMQPLTLQDLGKTPYAVIFEPQLAMVYVSADGGIIFVFREDPLNRENLQLATNPTVGPNARSLALDTSTGHLYVPTLRHSRHSGPARAPDQRVAGPGVTDQSGTRGAHPSLKEIE